MTQIPKEQSCAPTHAWHARPFVPQVNAVGNWQTPSASQQPLAQLVASHSGLGAPHPARARVVARTKRFRNISDETLHPSGECNLKLKTLTPTLS
jgi:hypothetical protein